MMKLTGKDVKCPKCHAGAGQRCVTTKKQGTNHKWKMHTVRKK